MDLLELLTAGDVEAFNKGRGEARRPPDFSTADLSEAKLPEVDFTGVNLEYADLSNADLSHALLARTNLCGADLTKTVLTGVLALRSRWREAYLGEADLSEADLSGSDMSDAEMTGAKAVNIVLNGAKLKRAMLDDADFTDADFTEARMNEANLSGGTFASAIFREANLSEAKLGGAQLMGADFTRARLAGCDLSNADLSGAVLRSADLTGANLTGAVLEATDLRRADLSGATLDGVDLSGAMLDDALLDRGVLGDVGPTSPDAAPLLIEDPHIAGTDDGVALLWENTESDGSSRLRVAVGKPSRKFKGKSVPLPVPTDPVLARNIAPGPDGWLAMALVERPAGTVATLIPIDNDGAAHPPRTVRLPYTPAVRPLLRFEEGKVRIYGIGREGPGLFVHEVTDDGLETLHVSRMPTARGFVGFADPVVLSKGGVVVALRPKGKGEPMRAPAGFPGRSCAAALVEGGAALAWIGQKVPGFYVARLEPGRAPEPEWILPEVPVGTLDLATVEDDLWALYTREPVNKGDKSTAWLTRLPGGGHVQVGEELDENVLEVRLSSGGGKPVAMLSLASGRVAVCSLSPRGSKVRWLLG